MDIDLSREARERRREKRDEARARMPALAAEAEERELERRRQTAAMLREISETEGRETMRDDDDADEAAMMRYLERRGEFDLRENVGVDETGKEVRHKGHSFRKAEEDDRDLDADGQDVLAGATADSLTRDARAALGLSEG